MEEKFWDKFQTFYAAEEAWDLEAERAAAIQPLKGLPILPKMPGIEEATKRNLKWKSLKWMVSKDHKFTITRFVLKSPLKHLFRYIRSLLQKSAYIREEDFFYYGLKNQDEFVQALSDPNTLFVVGFSYCEKPHECPSGRFTDSCVRDLQNPICRQCFIGKALHTLPKSATVPLIIPTVHYIGEKIFSLKAHYPDKTIVFLITACEMTLEMFGDWGNMAGIKGIGVRLDGRICNTFRAFELSERGVKPGLTVLLPATQRRILELLATWRSLKQNAKEEKNQQNPLTAQPFKRCGSHCRCN